MRYVEFCSQFNTMPQVRRTDGEQFLVYFLMLGDTIVYVGKSSESGVFSRLKSHQQDKEYDAYFVVNGLESDAEAMEIEKGFISLIRPQYNKADARVNLRAIMKVINLVTSPKAEATFKPSRGEGVSSKAELELIRAKVRSYRSRFSKGVLAVSEMRGKLKTVLPNERPALIRKIEKSEATNAANAERVAEAERLAASVAAKLTS